SRLIPLRTPRRRETGYGAVRSDRRSVLFPVSRLIPLRTPRRRETGHRAVRSDRRSVLFPVSSLALAFALSPHRISSQVPCLRARRTLAGGAHLLASRSLRSAAVPRSMRTRRRFAALTPSPRRRSARSRHAAG